MRKEAIWVTSIVVLLFTIAAVGFACGGSDSDADETVLTAEACSICHNNETALLASSLQWSASVHLTGGAFERNTQDCAGCHTSEGFVEILASGEETPAADIVDPTPPNCRTCHKIHIEFDETDWDLRVTNATTILLTEDTHDYGKGNICVGCHQPRTADAIPTPGGADVEITSAYWGPHHGTQSVVFLGVAGAEISGSESYENSLMTTEVTDSCVACHMAPARGNVAGGHQMGLEYEYHGSATDLVVGCNVDDCHGQFADLEDFDKDGKQTEIEALIEALEDKLLTEGILVEAYGSLSINANSTAPLTLSGDEASALWNYKLVTEDGSRGVHNYLYTKALLQNSMDILP
jgi:nitrate/TMAO reductase-like tetraheme cytochrome c subunit